jgi:hypothetical protein
VLACYGFNDPEIAAAIKAKMADPNVFTSLTLDSSRAAVPKRHMTQLVIAA